MRNLLKMYSLVLFFFLLSACEKNNEPVPTLSCEKGIKNHPNAAKYEKLLAKILETGVPGVSMTVITPDGVWSAAGGKADLKNNIDLNPCHVLRVGSVTKLFCATTILKLQDEKKLNINDKASKYLSKDIVDNIPNANLCTIKQLLNHTAGVPDYMDMNRFLGLLNLSIGKSSAEEALKSIYGKPARFAVGTNISYSNSHYLLLALIIKNISRKNAYEVVQEKLVKPLGLNNIYASTMLPSTLTKGYVDIQENGNLTDRTEIDNNAVGGQDMLDGGLMANSYDLALFHKALSEGRVLSPTSLAQMQTFTDINLGDNLKHLKQYGLGLMKIETDNGVAFGHYGGIYCFQAMLYHFPAQNVTVAIIRNGNSAKSREFFESKELFTYLF